MTYIPTKYTNIVYLTSLSFFVNFLSSIKNKYYFSGIFSLLLYFTTISLWSNFKEGYRHKLDKNVVIIYSTITAIEMFIKNKHWYVYYIISLINICLFFFNKYFFYNEIRYLQNNEKKVDDLLYWIIIFAHTVPLHLVQGLSMAYMVEYYP